MSIIFVLLATNGRSDPCSVIENNTTQNAIWKMSCSIVTPPTIAIIANTIDAAPLRPAHDTTRYCEIFVLNGASTVATANGLATNVINSAINIDGNKTVNIFDGNDRKNWRGKSMAEIEFPDGYLVIMIKRGDDVVIPVGSTIIEKNDELVLVSK